MSAVTEPMLPDADDRLIPADDNSDRNKARVLYGALAVIAAVATGAVLLITKHGAGMIPDSAVYIGTARNLAQGRRSDHAVQSPDQSVLAGQGRGVRRRGSAHALSAAVSCRAGGLPEARCRCPRRCEVAQRAAHGRERLPRRRRRVAFQRRLAHGGRGDGRPRGRQLQPPLRARVRRDRAVHARLLPGWVLAARSPAHGTLDEGARRSHALLRGRGPRSLHGNRADRDCGGGRAAQRNARSRRRHDGTASGETTTLAVRHDPARRRRGARSRSG